MLKDLYLLRPFLNAEVKLNELVKAIELISLTTLAEPLTKEDGLHFDIEGFYDEEDDNLQYQDHWTIWNDGVVSHLEGWFDDYGNCVDVTEDAEHKSITEFLEGSNDSIMMMM